MLGLGETDEEVVQALTDIRAANVDVVTFGQYMRPTKNHLPVQRFVTPEEFLRYRDIGMEMGFLRGRLRPAGALQLPRRARAGAQQRRAGSERAARPARFSHQRDALLI